MRAWHALAAVAAIVSVAHAAVEDDLREGDKAFDDGDWKKAATAFDRAIGKAPSQVTAEAYGKRAAIFIILKDYKGGLDFIAKAKLRFPTTPEVLEQEALLLWGVDKRDQAIAVAEKVVAAKPQSFSNQQIIGDYYSTRDPVKTATAFEAYLAHRPTELEAGDVLPRIRLGFAYLASARAELGTDDTRVQQLYTKAVDQFEYVARKLGKRPNAQVNADNGLCAGYAGLAKWKQAITVCERITQNPKQIDATGSVWFNLATAYLATKQPAKARNAASEFARIRKGEARGFMLIGDTLFADGDWPGALEQYVHADKLLRPNQAHDELELALRLGKTYRRLPAPATGPNPNLDRAIAKLSSALAGNPASIELAIELGGAYLDAKQAVKASQLGERVIASVELGKAPVEQRVAVLAFDGRALLDQRKLKEARQRLEAAQQLDGADPQLKRALIATINEQAFEALAKDPAAAQALVEQALAIDPNAPTTLTNAAVLAIDRGDCDGAQHHLVRLEATRDADPVTTTRLLARSYACASKPDPKRATEVFAAAEKAAKKANATLALAEIYTEWAPLVWDTDLDGAIEKLTNAVQLAAADPDVAPPAKRNLALALYRRGWRASRDGKAADAVVDFQRALREPSVLRGSEPLAFEFAAAFALLEANRAADAAKAFKALAAKGNAATYLGGAYAKVGPQLFAAYANARAATGPQRAQACSDLAKLAPELGERGKELVASCWEAFALDGFRAGAIGAAQKALAAADAAATPEQKRRLALDRTVLVLGKDKLGELEALAGNPPESLVDLGIVYELLGKPKEAYDAWLRARARGVVARDLQKWIDAKKRIYGF